MLRIERSDLLITICSIFLLIESLIWNICNVKKNEMELQLGHSKMNCREQGSLHIEQGLIQSHRHLTRKQWSHSELLKLRPKFTMTGLVESTCACIKKLGIKRRFRGYCIKRKPYKQTTRRKDQIQGVHLQFLKELNKVFLPKGTTSQQYIKIGIANVRSARGKT